MKSARSRAYALAAEFVRDAQHHTIDTEVVDELDSIATALERAAAATEESLAILDRVAREVPAK